jgi:hypothetical protein
VALSGTHNFVLTNSSSQIHNDQMLARAIVLAFSDLMAGDAARCIGQGNTQRAMLENPDMDAI